MSQTTLKGHEDLELFLQRLGKGRRDCQGPFTDAALVAMVEEMACNQLRKALAAGDGAAPKAGKSPTMDELEYSAWLLAHNDVSTRTFSALRSVVSNYLACHHTQGADTALDADAAGKASGALTLASASDRQGRAGAGGAGAGGLKGLAATSEGEYATKLSKSQKRLKAKLALAASEAEGTPARASAQGTGAQADLSKQLADFKSALAAFKGKGKAKGGGGGKGKEKAKGTPGSAVTGSAGQPAAGSIGGVRPPAPPPSDMCEAFQVGLCQRGAACRYKREKCSNALARHYWRKGVLQAQTGARKLAPGSQSAKGKEKERKEKGEERIRRPCRWQPR